MKIPLTWKTLQLQPSGTHEVAEVVEVVSAGAEVSAAVVVISVAASVVSAEVEAVVEEVAPLDPVTLKP